MSATSDHFPTEIAGLPEAREPEQVELADREQFDLRIAPVTKRLGEATVRMLAYNGSIPGPTLKVRQGSEIVVNIENQGDMDATVHWHGLRLENRYDGTHQTQEAMAVGEKFSAHVTFPDPGVYWYHPHIREDYGQEMGLYGNVLVEPAEPDYWPPVNREVVLTLDDILLEDGKVAPFSRAETTYAAMGRFGDVLLVNGEADLSMTAQLGEVVRFYLTNTANTRVFKVALPGTRMKLVGGDSGHVEREEFVNDVVLAPSERAVVDVVFDTPGELTLEHHTPERVYPLAAIRVSEDRAEGSLEVQFEVLRTNDDMVRSRAEIAPYLEAEPDKTLSFIAEMDMGAPEGDGPAVYTCPMHPEVVSDEGGHCPECGMKLLPAQMVAEAGGDHDHEGHHEHDAAHAHAPRRGRRHRVGGRHGRRQPDDHRGQHALEAHRPGYGRRERGDRLALPRRGPGQDPAVQRDGRRPSDAPPVPRSWGGSLLDPQPGWDRGAQSGVEGHGAGADRGDGRHSARRHQRRPLDGSLPHRRAPRERHDVQLHGRPVGEELRGPSGDGQRSSAASRSPSATRAVPIAASSVRRMRGRWRRSLARSTAAA